MQKVLPDLFEGHAPITLQRAFHDALEALEEWGAGSEEPRVPVDSLNVPISHVFAGMNACTDLMPVRTRGVLDAIVDSEVVRAPGGALYADAARLAMALCAKRLGNTAPRRPPTSAIAQTHQTCVEI